MIDSIEHHYQSLVSDGTDPLAASSTVKPYPTNSPILFRDLTQQERCEPLIAFTKVASRAPSHPHKRLTPETGCGHCINWVRSYSYEILLLIIPAVYMRKGCEAFGKREIIANAAFINMSLLQRVAPLHICRPLIRIVSPTSRPAKTKVVKCDD